MAGKKLSGFHDLSRQQQISARVREFYSHCSVCNIWIENERLDEKGVCDYCRKEEPLLPED